MSDQPNTLTIEQLRAAVAAAWKCWNNQRPVDAITVNTLIQGTKAYLRLMEGPTDEMVEALRTSIKVQIGVLIQKKTARAALVAALTEEEK